MFLAVVWKCDAPLLYSSSSPLKNLSSATIAYSAIYLLAEFSDRKFYTGAIINRPARKMQLLCFRHFFAMAETSKKRPKLKRSYQFGVNITTAILLWSG